MGIILLKQDQFTDYHFTDYSYVFERFDQSERNTSQIFAPFWFSRKGRYGLEDENGQRFKTVRAELIKRSRGNKRCFAAVVTTVLAHKKFATRKGTEQKIAPKSNTQNKFFLKAKVIEELQKRSKVDSEPNIEERLKENNERLDNMNERLDNMERNIGLMLDHIKNKI